VAAGAVGTGLPLGLVPGGTGNLLAGNLRLPRRPADAARLLLRARPRAIDLGQVQRADGLHYFAVCGGTGFDARLMALTGSAEKRRWRMGAYVARAFAALVRGPANGSRQLWFGRGREVRVEVLEGPSAPVQLDGEVTGETPFQVRLVPGALRVLVDPATASQRRDRRG